MKYTLLIVLLIVTGEMNGQTKSKTIAGEYYLSGVMETASGFKIDADSTFQFFFSYGALDRFGKGKWTLNKATLILNSEAPAKRDFTLLKSSESADDSIEIKLIEENPVFLTGLFARIRSGEKVFEQVSDNSGIIRFPKMQVDSLTLIFKFSAERSAEFTDLDKNHNRFEFRLEPAVMEVYFKEFKLNVTTEGLSGLHPLLTGKTYTYRKAR